VYVVYIGFCEGVVDVIHIFVFLGLLGGTCTHDVLSLAI